MNRKKIGETGIFQNYFSDFFDEPFFFFQDLAPCKGISFMLLLVMFCSIEK